jgi:phage baseplate assembly protein V
MQRDLVDQLRHLLRPLATRVANTIVRGVVQLADDSTKLQLIQLGGLAGETIDNAEHFQQYGLSSVPLAGAECVVIFPNGDRSHPIMIAASDRRYRPTGGDPGEVVVYNNTDAKVTITKDGDIKVQAAPGRQILMDDGSGTLTALDGVVTGRGIDPYTSMTYAALNNASSVVRAKK